MIIIAIIAAIGGCALAALSIATALDQRFEHDRIIKLIAAERDEFERQRDERDRITNDWVRDLELQKPKKRERKVKRLE